MKSLTLTLTLTLTLSLTLPLPAQAEGTEDEASAPVAVKPTRAPAASKANGPKRSNSLKFDDSLIEGMNGPNLNSLTLRSNLDGSENGRLYKTRENFKRENQQLM